MIEQKELVDVVQLAQFAGLTAQQIVGALHATIDVDSNPIIIARDDSLWSYRGIADRFGVGAAEGLYETIVNASMPAAALAYAGSGLQVSNPQTQEELLALAAGLRALAPPQTDLANVCDAIRAIGITYGAVWQMWLTVEPTLDLVMSTITQLATDNWIAQVRDEILTNNRTKSIVEIKALIAAQG